MLSNLKKMSNSLEISLKLKIKIHQKNIRKRKKILDDQQKISNSWENYKTFDSKSLKLLER